MPHLYPTQLRNYLETEDNLQLAVGVRLDRKDGLVLGLCSHPFQVRLPTGTPGICPITPGGLVLHASPGMAARPAIARSDLGVDNSAFDGWVTPDILDETELFRGLWDDAKCLIFLFSYSHINYGTGYLGGGRLGRARFKGDGMFEIAARSLEDVLQSEIGERTSATCRNPSLGEGTCPVNVATGIVGGFPLQSATTVSAISGPPFDRRSFKPNVAMGTPNGFYSNGKVLWTSGDNAGQTSEIKSHSSGYVEIWEDTIYPIKVGDGVQVTAGCNFTWGMCTGTYAAFGAPARFNGEPFIPGEDVYAINR